MTKARNLATLLDADGDVKASALDNATVTTADVVSALTAGNNITIAADGTISASGSGGGTSMTAEEVQDIVGAMLSGNTETNIVVTYDDVTGKINFDATGATGPQGPAGPQGPRSHQQR